MTSQDLAGQVAAVTGAAQGIGLAIARCLHDRGATVWLLDVDRPAVPAQIGRLVWDWR